MLPKLNDTPKYELKIPSLDQTGKSIDQLVKGSLEQLKLVVKNRIRMCRAKLDGAKKLSGNLQK